MRMEAFAAGAGVIFNGLKNLRYQRELRKYIYIPLVVDVLLLILGITWGLSYLGSWVSWALAWVNVGGFWEGILAGLLWVVLFLAFVLLLFYVVLIFSVILAAPFHALLAERTLMLSGVLKEQPFRWGPWIAFSIRMLAVSLLKAMLFTSLWVVLFVLSLIPGLNLIAIAGLALIFAYDIVDYSYEALGYGLWRRLQHFLANSDFFAGLALAMGLTMLIPGLSFLLLPIAIVGAGDALARSQRLPH